MIEVPHPSWVKIDGSSVIHLHGQAIVIADGFDASAILEHLARNETQTGISLLHANREDAKVVQELLRHSSIKVAMNIYTQAVTPEKRKALSRVVEMIAPRPKPEAGNAHDPP